MGNLIIVVSEPAILVMYHSIRPHPAITATLLDFLCRVSIRDNLFGYLNDFSYFPLKIAFWKLLDMVRTGKKWTILKGGVDVLAIFIDCSYLIF